MWWAKFWISCNLNLASLISNSFCPVSFLDNLWPDFAVSKNIFLLRSLFFLPMSHFSERGLRLGKGEEEGVDGQEQNHEGLPFFFFFNWADGIFLKEFPCYFLTQWRKSKCIPYPLPILHILYSAKQPSVEIWILNSAQILLVQCRTFYWARTLHICLKMT